MFPTRTRADGTAEYLVTVALNFSSRLVQRPLLRMFLVVNHLAVGVLFLVYLFLLCPVRYLPLALYVRVLLLLNGAVIGPQLLRLLLVERAVL